MIRKIFDLIEVIAVGPKRQIQEFEDPWQNFHIDVTAVSGQYTVLGSEDHLDAVYSNRKDVNFYAPSGEQNYFLGVHSVNSGA